MKTFNYTHSSGLLWILLLLFNPLTPELLGQPPSICNDWDCPTSVFSIQVDRSLQPDGSNPRRTEQFKTAYLQLKQIKNNAALDSRWLGDYRSNGLGGRSCLRFNQLESYFAYEYEQNPAFKQFIDRNEPNITAFKEDAFESSRRAMNLQKRIKDSCPSEIRKLDQTEAPSSEDFKKVYNKLGQVLGYFDEDGNTIKALPDLPPPTKKKKSRKPKKKERIAQMKSRLDQLPVGQQKRDQLQKTATALAASQPDQDQLNRNLEDLEPRFTALSPKPNDLSTQLEQDEFAISDLKSFKPERPDPKLSAKLNELSEEANDLKAQTTDLVGNTQALRDRYNRLLPEPATLKDQITERERAIEKMKSELDDLETRKKGLMDKLNDKPKKRELDGLNQQVETLELAAVELSERIRAEDQEKKKLLDKLGRLNNEHEEIAAQLGQLEDKAETLIKAEQELEEKIKACENRVAEIKAEEAKRKGLKEQLDDLKSEETLNKRINTCETYLQELLEKVNEVEEAKTSYERESAGMPRPARIQEKLNDLQLFVNNLKLGGGDLVITDGAMKKLDNLLSRAKILSSNVEILDGKQNRVQRQIDNLDQSLKQAKTHYTELIANLDDLRTELAALTSERADLQQKVQRAVGDVNEIDALAKNFLDRYKAFEENTKCLNKEGVLESLREEQTTVEKELKRLEGELGEADQFGNNLEEEGKVIEDNIKVHTELVAQLDDEKKFLEERFNQDMSKLEAVLPEEWKDQETVNREYWTAAVQDDPELVRDYKGKYFEIRLNSVENRAKVLFNLGRYYMDETQFFASYGATIGSFVTEAIHFFKKDDAGRVKLFIQGSADMTGNETFRGRLNPKFRYEEISLLPMEEDMEHFSSISQQRAISKNSFRNEDLPNLRAQFLKDMIAEYGTKFDPIILEGVVKENVGEEDRNAVIYLFFPEEILARY